MSPIYARTAIALLICALPVSCTGAARPAARPATTQPLASPSDLPGLANFAIVSPALYRGAQPTDAGFRRLRDMGVKTVIDLRGRSHRDPLEALGLKYVHIPSSAGQVEKQKVIEFLRIVTDPANQPVFVHCRRGADRTGCYVASYRVVEQGWTAHDAEVELDRFHFSHFWHDIPEFLDHMDPQEIRRALASATTRPAPPPARSQGNR